MAQEYKTVDATEKKRPVEQIKALQYKTRLWSIIPDYPILNEQ